MFFKVSLPALAGETVAKKLCLLTIAGETGGSEEGARQTHSSPHIWGVAHRLFARVVAHSAFQKTLQGSGLKPLLQGVADLPLPLESLLPVVDAHDPQDTKVCGFIPFIFIFVDANNPEGTKVCGFLLFIITAQWICVGGRPGFRRMSAPKPNPSQTCLV